MAKSSQLRLERVRPPRVNLTYEIESDGVTQARELSFVIGVLGDFSGHGMSRVPLKDRRFHCVDWDSFDDVLASIRPRVHFKIPAPHLQSELDIDIAFSRIEDFDPQHLIDQIDPLRTLKASGDWVSLRRCLDQVLHAPEFQRIESTWRGLWYLVSRVETSTQLRIQFLDTTKEELLRDLQRASDATQSALFKEVYEQPYGTFGSDPFSVFIGDFFFSNSAEDIYLLGALAEIASHCLAPFITAAAPEMFGIDSFERIFQFRELDRIFDGPEYAKWTTFRQTESARYLALTVPRVLLRSPWGVRPGSSGEFQYQEEMEGNAHLLWGNAAYAFAVCIADAFARFGWCGAIRGIEGGGLVEGLPTWLGGFGDEGSMRSSVEILIADRREKELADQGFLPLVQHRRMDYAVFFSTQSCAKPKVFDNDAASAYSRLSCQLQYTLTAARFMHYLRAIFRDNVGSYHTRGAWEARLNTWIRQYVLQDDQASPAVQALHPLREARIDVAENPEQPGVYRAVAYLRPHYQLAELSTSIRLICDLK